MNAAAVLSKEFERCRPWIEATLAAERHEESADEVLAMVLDGRAQLWPGRDAVVLTQLANEAGALVLTYWFMGGRLTGALTLHPMILANAAKWGCVEVRCAPFRRAWKRIGQMLGFSEIRSGVWGKKL